MKKFRAILFCTFLSFSLSAQGPGDILDMCIVFELDIAKESDLLKASYKWPFVMGRRTKDQEKVSVAHYMIDLPNKANTKLDLKNGIRVVGIRGYSIEGKSLEDLSSSLAPNEIAFNVSFWPERKLGKHDSEFVASFPSKNKELVTTDHLIIGDELSLPDVLVNILELPFDKLAPGKYPIFKVEY